MNTAACANTIVNMVENKTIEQAWEITPEAVAGYLETLPKDHFHCAELDCRGSIWRYQTCWNFAGLSGRRPTSAVKQI